MDAFFVSVELVRRPELRGKPVVVGGTGARGVVAAASYEARAYGVHSAMPASQARRRCPQAVFLPGDHAHYSEVSARIMAVLRSYTPLVEPLSLDEAFLDVAGARRLHGPPEVIAAALRAEILERERLSSSVGCATVKFLAKLASEAAKPRADPRGPRPGLGVVAVRPGEELEFLHPLPVRALWGVGPATLAKLERLGIRTVGDLAAVGRSTLERALGAASGRHLHALACCLDDRGVEPHQQPKSVGHEETFARDHHRHATLHRELVRMADATAGRLRRNGLAGRTVTIKVRFADFHTITRSTTLAAAVDGGSDIARAAGGLLARVDPAPGVRLLGVSVSGLSTDAPRQLTLDGAAGEVARVGVTAAIDAIRARFGDDAVVPATLAGPSGVRVKRRGDQQWGPER
ncbi:MAG: DNA polymerase IV [Actinobacteria bacterium]|nr:DNA polymerase IV [Actinomycetota bacterium]